MLPPPVSKWQTVVNVTLNIGSTEAKPSSPLPNDFHLHVSSFSTYTQDSSKNIPWSRVQMIPREINARDLTT